MRTTQWISSLFVAGVLCAGSVLAADVAAPATEKTGKLEKTGIDQQHSKKDCVRKDGKPCTTVKKKKTKDYTHGAAAKKGAAQPTTDAKNKTNAGAVAGAAAAPAAAAAKPASVEVKSETLSDADGLVLAKKHNCLACHAIDKKVVGPAFKDVSGKYKGAAKYVYGGKEYPLEEGMMLKVSKGGSGNWGAIPMTANDPNGTKQADIRALVKFILSLK